MKVTDIGLKPKDLVGIPWRVAFALQDAGWYLRSDIIWSKPNPMPESVTDRPTKAHEYIFLLAKSERYYYDNEAIKEPAKVWEGKAATFERTGLVAFHVLPGQTAAQHRPNRKQDALGKNTYTGFNDRYAESGGVAYRNRRSVWTVATRPYSGAHFATFPPALVEPMILAGSRTGDIVLDPFSGSGTVGRVSAKHGRRFVGLELNPSYIELAQHRTSKVQIAFQL
jgi:DNA modification methylase